MDVPVMKGTSARTPRPPPRHRLQPTAQAPPAPSFSPLIRQRPFLLQAQLPQHLCSCPSHKPQPGSPGAGASRSGHHAGNSVVQLCEQPGCCHSLAKLTTPWARGEVWVWRGSRGRVSTQPSEGPWRPEQGREAESRKETGSAFSTGSSSPPASTCAPRAAGESPENGFTCSWSSALASQAFPRPGSSLIKLPSLPFFPARARLAEATQQSTVSGFVHVRESSFPNKG